MSRVLGMFMEEELFKYDFQPCLLNLWVIAWFALCEQKLICAVSDLFDAAIYVEYWEE